MNRRDFLQRAAAGLTLLTLNPTAPFARAAAEDVVATEPVEAPLAGPPRGPWRRLFLDAAAVEARDGLTREFPVSEKHPEPVVRRDQPWEGVSAITGPYVYGTVFAEGDRLRMWYEVLYQGTNTGYAESRDGIHWTKPALGLIAFEGNRATNLVVSASARETTGGACHNASVLRRPGATDPEQRYALYGFDPKLGHPRVAYSPDGLRWRFDPATEKTPLFTSSDVVNFFYDPYQTRYTATWKTRNRRGRAVGVAWSADGRRWTKPVEGPVFVADDLDPDATQIYGMPVFPYQGLYLGLPWLYHARYFRYGDYSVKKLHEAQEDSPRTMDTHLAWSWDLINWTRPQPRAAALVPLGAAGAWDAGMIVTARAPVIRGDELWFYYGGCDGIHDAPRVNAAIGLARLRLDGFCAMRAGNREGWLITRREPFRTPAVTINAKTGADGFVTAEILDRRNRVLPGFSRRECLAFTGDSVRHTLRWKTDRFGEAQRAEDYKLRFWLRNAALFSYLPADLDPNQPDLARFPLAGP